MCAMQRNKTPCYYHDYLQLEKLLGSQKPESRNYGKEAHDEMLFIIVHQAYELWFKQILHELYSVFDDFSDNDVPASALGRIVSRLERIVSIQSLMIEQIKVLETMTPLDFLDFRDYLVPASGFQSIQFKEIEILLGLKANQRINFDQESFYSRLTKKDREYLIDLESKSTIFDQVEAWLERIPYMDYQNFTFWKSYEDAVNKMLDRDGKIIVNNDYLSENDRDFQLADLEKTKATFHALFNEKEYLNLQKKGNFRLSQKALLGALFINLYRDQPVFQLPFRLLTALVDIDERFTTWRYRHVMMVQRMLGMKIGTGGSSGTDYLKQTTENNRFFKDLFGLSTFLLPRSEVPVLPDELAKAMDFYFNPAE